MENQILGLCIRSADALSAALSTLKTNDFTSKQTRLSYDAMSAVKETGAAVNVVTVTAMLQSSSQLDEVGGVEYLQRIAEAENGKPEEVISYCQILKQFSYKRRIGYVGRKLVEFGKSPENGKEFRQKISQITKFALDDQTAEDSCLTPGGIAHKIGFSKLIQPLLGEVAVDTPWDEWNDLLIGFFGSTVNVLAARPGVGKSTIAAQIALRCAMKMQPALFISLEMTREALVLRLMCGIAKVDLKRCMMGDLSPGEKTRLVEALTVIENVPLEITDGYGHTVPEIEQCARVLTSKYGVPPALVVADHLQQMRAIGKHQNRHGEIAEITWSAHDLSKALKTRFILLSQLNRGGGKREDKAPQLEDLMESGAIEANADTVGFIHRPEMYKRDGDKSLTEIYYRKNRSGEIGMFNLKFLPQYTLFVNQND